VLLPTPVAFSRDGPSGEAKTYVQTVLGRPAQAETVRALVQAGASIYVAGAAGSMPKEVRKAVRICTPALRGKWWRRR